MPISLLNTNPLILLVNPGVKANSVQELIALAKAEPDRLNYSSSGLGGLMYFSAELFKAKTGTQDDARALSRRRAGHHGGDRGRGAARLHQHVGRGQPARRRQGEGARGHHLEAQPVGAERADARRAGHRRLPHRSWNALFAPKGTPQPAIDRMAQIAAEMAKDPAVQKQMANFGSVAVANTPAEFAKMLRDETALWADLVKQIGAGK